MEEIPGLQLWKWEIDAYTQLKKMAYQWESSASDAENTKMNKLWSLALRRPQLNPETIVI